MSNSEPLLVCSALSRHSPKGELQNEEALAVARLTGARSRMPRKRRLVNISEQSRLRSQFDELAIAQDQDVTGAS